MKERERDREKVKIKQQSDWPRLSGSCGQVDVESHRGARQRAAPGVHAEQGSRGPENTASDLDLEFSRHATNLFGPIRP